MSQNTRTNKDDATDDSASGPGEEKAEDAEFQGNDTTLSEKTKVVKGEGSSAS